MAIRDLLWACPLCATTGGLRANRRGDRCHACGAEFRRDTGATILASTGSGEHTRLTAAQWLERLPPIETPGSARDEPGSPRDACRVGSGERHVGSGPVLLPAELGPEPVVVRTAVRKQPVRQGRELIGWLDRFGPRRQGTLALTRDRVRFEAPDGSIEWPLDRITAIQPTSSKLQLAASRLPVAAIRFQSGSVRLWEEAIREAVRRAWRASGRGEIAEFHPRITTR